jgi:uncharacterized coiled-coil protein SlyX
MQMRDKLEQRLTELRNELASGQQMINELDARRAELQTTMLRITGAIQVIEEVLQPEPAAELPSPLSTPAVSATPRNGASLAAD